MCMIDSNLDISDNVKNSGVTVFKRHISTFRYVQACLNRDHKMVCYNLGFM